MSYQNSETNEVILMEEEKKFFTTQSVTKFIVVPLFIAGCVMLAVSTNGGKTLFAGSVKATNLSKKSVSQDFLGTFGSSRVYDKFFSNGDKVTLESYVPAAPAEKNDANKHDHFYATVSAYNDDTCQGGANSQVFMAGLVAGECLAGVLIDCSQPDMIIANEYHHEDCTGEVKKSTVVATDLSACVNGRNYQCTSSKNIHMGESIIQRTFVSNDCQTTSPAQVIDSSFAGESFVAYRTGVCISPSMLDKDETQDYSFMFSAEAASLKGVEASLTLDTYGNDKCNNKAYSETLSSECEDVKPNYGDYQTGMQAWSYMADSITAVTTDVSVDTKSAIKEKKSSKKSADKAPSTKSSDKKSPLSKTPYTKSSK